MSATTVVHNWLREIGAREESVHVTRTHVHAETMTDVDAICATVSRDVFFGVPVRTRAGNEIPDGTVLTTYDQVHDYYANRAGGYVVTDSLQLKTLGSHWYTFNESAATLEGTGTIGDVDASGREFVVNSAVLFPTAPDGIRGEVCVTRYPFPDIVRGDVQVEPPPPGGPSYLPLREMQHSEVADDLLLAIEAGDADRVASNLAGSHTMAVRLDGADGSQRVHTGTSRAEAVTAFGAMFAGTAELTVLTKVATDWYVFVEYLMHLDGGGVRRLAATHPTAGGLLAGTFGYGFEEAPSTP